MQLCKSYFEALKTLTMVFKPLKSKLLIIQYKKTEIDDVIVKLYKEYMKVKCYPENASL